MSQSKRLPHVAATVEDLTNHVARLNAVKQKSFDWIKETFDINYWDFRRKSSWAINWFEILMDNADWELLASDLNLHNEEITWCRKYHKDGPTREVFSRLEKNGQHKDLTLGHVLNILQQHNLLAILSQRQWQEGINNFRAVNTSSREASKPVSPNKFGYECGMKTNPSICPSTLTFQIHQAPEVLVCSANVGSVGDAQLEDTKSTPAKKPVKSVFAARIIMIFASDARDEALRAAKQLRSSRGTRKEIGVMILTPPNSEAIANALLEDPGNSIYKWFKQVDYVVPVLSQQLLRQMQDRDNDRDTISEKQYNRFIYRLLVDDFVSSMSKNYKCRALYTPDHCTEVRNSELVKGNGLLQMNWDCSSEEQLEQVGEILISGAREKRRNAKQNSQMQN